MFFLSSFYFLIFSFIFFFTNFSQNTPSGLFWVNSRCTVYDFVIKASGNLCVEGGETNKQRWGTIACAISQQHICTKKRAEGLKGKKCQTFLNNALAQDDLCPPPHGMNGWKKCYQIKKVKYKASSLAGQWSESSLTLQSSRDFIIYFFLKRSGRCSIN